mgnify:FL=1
MKRTILITVLALASAVFLCTDVLAGKKPQAPNKVIQPGSVSGNRWIFEGRLVTVPNAADLKKDRLAAEAGDASAQFRMALRYESGTGVPQDYAESVKWLRKAADQGLPEAQFNMGSMYMNGLGVPEDPAEGFGWYRKAAFQGHASAQKNVGAMYGRGQGVAQDHSEAYVWSSIAVMSGNESAAGNRDVAASQLSPQQLDAAQKREAVLYNEIQQ